MSENVGQVYFAREKQSRFLDLPGLQGAIEYSEATAELIDKEVKTIIKGQYDTALEILRGKLALLKKGASILLEKETISGDELQAMEDNLAEVAD